MKFTSLEEYGLRCMVAMARHEERNALTIAELAKLERLTPAYIAKLMRILRRGGLVDSLHGPQGGYRLARPSQRITVADILAPLGSPLYEPRLCRKNPGDSVNCVHSSECAIRTLWVGLDLVVRQVLKRTRLSDLIKSEKSIAQLMRETLPQVLEAVAQMPSGAGRREAAKS